MDWIALLRTVLAYVAPMLTAVAAGSWQPFPPGSWLNIAIVFLAGGIVAAFSLRVHPNGLNGPPKAEKPQLPSK